MTRIMTELDQIDQQSMASHIQPQQPIGTLARSLGLLLATWLGIQDPALLSQLFPLVCKALTRWCLLLPELPEKPSDTFADMFPLVFRLVHHAPIREAIKVGKHLIGVIYQNRASSLPL